MSLAVPTSPLPSIHISFAPPAEPVPEPYSPFPPLSPATPEANDDAFRPMLLSPPPLYARSPLRPASSQGPAPGLDRERFEALLKASRERNAMTGGKRGPDLRKEVALKVHKSKQAERRALFLSKVEAPPSPSATTLPKTPPESPAVFHYSLPSPGLVSPLALFESLGLDDGGFDAGLAPRRAWVEQVDFRLPKKASVETASARPMPTTRLSSNRKKSLPSLEQITAHMSIHGHGPAAHTAATPVPRSPIPLPAFLQSNRPPSPPRQPIAAPPPRIIRSIGTGRLKLPLRSVPAPAPAPTCALPAKPLDSTRPVAPSRPDTSAPLRLAAPTPRSPRSPQPHVLQVTTTLIPRTSSTSPVQLTAANLLALDSRARTAQDMISTLRRRARVPSPPLKGIGSGSVDGNAGRGEADLEEERKGRRISAPAELIRTERTGFSHPVLNIPGGF